MMNDNHAHVLVVDDEVLDAVFIRRALEFQGFTVEVASNHSSAIHIFDHSSQPFDILIADVSLPGKNGVEIAKELLHRTSSLKVLFTSGWVGAELIRTYGIPEADRHFLEKPFSASALVTRVREILESSERIAWLDDSQFNDKESQASNGK